jgi:hypothetical protein
MTTARSIACGSCGSDVPYGRLSCPSCGDLLASVAGGTRRVSSPEGAGAAGLATAAGTATLPGSTTDAVPVAARSGGRRITPSVLQDAVEPAAGPMLADDEADDVPLGVGATVEAATPQEFEAPVEAGAPQELEAPGDPSVPVVDDGGLELLTDDAGDDLGAPQVEPRRGPVASTAWPPLGATPDVPPIVDGQWVPTAVYAPPPAGAYVPPSGGIATAGMAATMAMPGGPAAPARTWAGYGHGPADGHGVEMAASAATGDALSERARITEFTGWLAIAGGALAAVGFLLPWGVSMIGARGTDYFGRWGVAGPFHVFVVLAVVAVVVLAIVPNRIPAWIRIGLAGTVLGVFLLGLVWPYVFGLSAPGPGAYAVGVGALALLAAGITSLVTDRHGTVSPPV